MMISARLRRGVELGWLSVMIVGPLAHYGASLLLFGLGAISIAALTTEVEQSLLAGGIAGALATAVCGGRPIGPQWVAHRTGVLALALWAVPYFGIAGMSRMSLPGVMTLAKIVAVMAAAAWVTGYAGVLSARRLFPRDWKGEVHPLSG